MLTDRNCMVTGASDGIGKATAIGLANMNAHVVMVCRNREKGEEVRQEITNQTGNQKIYLLIADFASFRSIREMVEAFRSEFNHLHVLINNAGAFFSSLGYTEDGIERQFAINHLAPFLLTNLLLDMLKDSAPSRIVNVASDAHTNGKIHFDDLNLADNYSGFMAYAQSKLANILFTSELHKRLEGSGVTANSLHPGVVSTPIGQKHSKVLHNILWGIGRLFMTTTQKGAETPVYLASSEDVEGVSGKYFKDKQVIEPSQEAQDDDIAERLWEVSEEWTGLKEKVSN